MRAETRRRDGRFSHTSPRSDLRLVRIAYDSFDLDADDPCDDLPIVLGRANLASPDAVLMWLEQRAESIRRGPVHATGTDLKVPRSLVRIRRRRGGERHAWLRSADWNWGDRMIEHARTVGVAHVRERLHESKVDLYYPSLHVVRVLEQDAVITALNVVGKTARLSEAEYERRRRGLVRALLAGLFETTAEALRRRDPFLNYTDAAAAFRGPYLDADVDRLLDLSTSRQRAESESVNDWLVAEARAAGFEKQDRSGRDQLEVWAARESERRGRRVTYLQLLREVAATVVRSRRWDSEADCQRAVIVALEKRWSDAADSGWFVCP